MRVLITGGAGFIGSHLAEALLRNGDEVYVLDNLSTGTLDNVQHLRLQPAFHLVVDSILNVAVLRDLVEKVDHVYHLAAAVGVKLVVESPLLTLETNLRGTSLVLQFADRFRKRVFLASTSELYGRQPENRPLKESDDRHYGPTTVGRWSYAESKAIDEFQGLAYHRERALDVVIARFFNIVGPRQTGRYGMVIPRFVEAALRGAPIEVHGDGHQTRSFTHVRDCVWAVRRLMQCADAIGQVINVGNPRSVTIRALAEQVKSMTASASEIRYVPYEEVYGPGFEDMEFRTPSVDLAQRLIDYRPTTELNGILTDVIEYFRAQWVTHPALESSLLEANRPK